MASTQLQNRLAKETADIDAALMAELDHLPSPCQPVARHIIAAGGKRLRPFLAVISARMFGYGQNDIYRLGASLEMLHAATLLHDDVLDNADARRSQPAAHILHGASAAILGGDALLALGNAIVASFHNPALSLAYSRATMQTAAGEVLEMASLRDPGLTDSQYLAIVKGKTACLIAQACVMGAIIAKASQEQIQQCEAFGENLGIAFQLVDDALDFAPESQTGKPKGGDLREGKFTPPLRLYRKSLAPDIRAEFDKAFQSGSFPAPETVINAIAAFATPSLALANEPLAKARDALSHLPRNAENAILAEMAEYVRLRRK